MLLLLRLGQPGISRFNKGYLNTLPTVSGKGVIERDKRRKNILNEIVSM